MKGMLHGKNEILPNPFSPEFVNTRLQEGDPAKPGRKQGLLTIKRTPHAKNQFYRLLTNIACDGLPKGKFPTRSTKSFGGYRGSANQDGNLPGCIRSGFSS